ncbi:NAD(P)H-dependent oxidoreductase [Govanella unica]|uniref:NAD(P)H-dependent oxidoreductase n=1 Tax=Govanella unica TaxID=2975056 RepID=A0A9X3TW67_9PROT|nr:NAD(P)H-dependent oxidoreductase [Govania unica]MDA5192851.1 NAD(P)H-dependent oxidoreductase [Govania unica]
MARHITIIQGHPDAEGGHLCHTLADSYADAAVAAGHEVRRIDVALIEFPILRSQADYQSQHAPPNLGEAQEDILWADHLVLVFPLWLGSLPALFKAFLEQVLRPGFAFAYDRNNIPKRLLHGRSARVVVTMGMPAWAYRWYFRSHALRALEHNILRFVGIKPVRTMLCGLVESASDRTFRGWIKDMAKHGTRGD